MKFLQQKGSQYDGLLHACMHVRTPDAIRCSKGNVIVARTSVRWLLIPTRVRWQLVEVHMFCYRHKPHPPTSPMVTWHLQKECSKEPLPHIRHPNGSWTSPSDILCCILTLTSTLSRRHCRHPSHSGYAPAIAVSFHRPSSITGGLQYKVRVDL
jgi:hypothetical protein